MNFSDKLNTYIKQLNCSFLELSKASTLSNSTISRYCNGNRIPTNPSEQLNKLIIGLSKIAETKNITNINKESIKQDFETILKSYDIEKIINNFNQLVTILKINISDFSKTLGFDPSHLSRIRSGERKPSNPSLLFETICNYIIINYRDNDSKQKLSSLFKCSIKEIDNDIDYKIHLKIWLYSDYNDLKTDDNIRNFFVKLNDFDLNQYIKVIKFDELKVPTIPFKLPKSKNYYGIEKMKQGELNFLKLTILSKSTKDVFMCSDMQMDDMAKDLDFGKKWMFGIAMMLKKGLHLNIIHNLDRPFNEMMVGLESWIPIYMTGQVSPFYLTNTQDNIYSHLNYVSDSIAITGECIKGHHNKGKYYLTNNKIEVNYYKDKTNLLLKKAKPLMNIYRDKDINLLNDFLNTSINIEGKRKIISSSLPIYTISEKLLIKILEKNKISKNDIKRIRKYIENEKSKMNKILLKNQVQEAINKISKKEFGEFPIFLELSGLFYNKKILYSYEEYLEHFEETKKFAINNNNYNLIYNKKNIFRNIKIFIILNKWVMISKNDNPTIHFIIKQPKLCKAIENFIVPIIEQ